MTKMHNKFFVTLPYLIHTWYAGSLINYYLAKRGEADLGSVRWQTIHMAPSVSPTRQPLTSACGATCASTQDARCRFDGLPPSFDARVFACRATRLTFGAQLGNIRGCFARSKSPRKIVGVIIFEAFRFHERSRRICGRYRVSFVHCRWVFPRPLVTARRSSPVVTVYGNAEYFRVRPRCVFPFDTCPGKMRLTYVLRNGAKERRDRRPRLSTEFFSNELDS